VLERLTGDEQDMKLQQEDADELVQARLTEEDQPKRRLAPVKREGTLRYSSPPSGMAAGKWRQSIYAVGWHDFPAITVSLSRIQDAVVPTREFCLIGPREVSGTNKLGNHIFRI
jgi:hypothetical protein